MPQPFVIQLHTPTVARRCIRCAQLIAFDWDEFPVVADRRSMRQIAVFYAHPNVAACEAEIARARRLEQGETPGPADIGLQRAALLRALVDEAQTALVDALEPDLDPDADDGRGEVSSPAALSPINYAKRTRGSRERRGVKPYGGLL
jgi:hypothetical protein